MRTKGVLSGVGAAGIAVLVAQIHAGSPVCSLGDIPFTPCPNNPGADVVVGDLNGIFRYGTVGTVTAYAIGTTACNVGDTVLQWDADNSDATHPLIAQNMYRYLDGRFEQIGMSWLKHTFSTVTQNLCCVCQDPGNTQVLGVGCADPYGFGLNGDQGGFCTSGGLGPRFEVNASTGDYAFPYTAQCKTGNAIYKRLQVHNIDLDPTKNVGALYYGEGHYVAADDAMAGNQNNNASYEPVTITDAGNGVYEAALGGLTTRGCPAIYAWQENDPQVEIEILDDLNDGRFHLGYRVTDNGDGTWHYEYALHNMSSHQSAGSFTVPIRCGVRVTNIGFHDVDYHSGDGEGGVNFDGTDWSPVQVGSELSWSTDTFASNANANALRWGTLYNFRFDADQPPALTTVTIGLFRPGTPTEVTDSANAPADPQSCPWDCGNFDCHVGIEDMFALFGQWLQAGGSCDFNGGIVDITDLFEMFGNWGVCP